MVPSTLTLEGVMSFFIEEHGVGACVERKITVGALVLPGVALERHNLGPSTRPDSTLDVADLMQAADRIRSQAERTWRRFEIQVDGFTIHYRFEFVVESSYDDRPVREWVPQAGRPPMESRRVSDAKSYREAIREAQRRGLLNIVVVHPNLGGRNPTAPRVDDDGQFVSVRHGDPVMLDRTSNVITVDRDSFTAPTRQTVAHEFGHALGLGHMVRMDSIMYSGDCARAVTEPDREHVHDSTETFGSAEGVYWRGYHLQRQHSSWAEYGRALRRHQRSHRR